MQHIAPISRTTTVPSKAQDPSDILQFFMDIIALGSDILDFLTELEEFKGNDAT